MNRQGNIVSLVDFSFNLVLKLLQVMQHISDKRRLESSILSIFLFLHNLNIKKIPKVEFYIHI